MLLKFQVIQVSGDRICTKVWEIFFLWRTRRHSRYDVPRRAGFLWIFLDSGDLFSSISLYFWNIDWDLRTRVDYDYDGLCRVLSYQEIVECFEFWGFPINQTGLLSPWSADDWVSWTHHLPCDWLSPRIMGVSAIKHEHVPDWNDNFSEDITGNSPIFRWKSPCLINTSTISMAIFNVANR